MIIKKLFKKIFGHTSEATPQLVARVIARNDHTLSRKDIPSSALKVLYGLKDAGFVAYLVGGCVRDLLLGLKPKDFDVATDAHPEQARKLFRNSRLIGRRFKLLHVGFGHDIVEVSTFRKATQRAGNKDHAHSEHGLVVRDNVYATAKEIDQDAIRRDFTVNALYYNIKDFTILDFVDGLSDLQQRRLRVIGDPEVRFREDPVRLIRAIRLAAKVGLELDAAIIKAIPASQQLLSHISPARLFDEMLKIIMSGNASTIFLWLQRYHVLDFLMPEVHKALQQDPEHYSEKMINLALKNTDVRLKEHKTINPAFMLAVWYWPIFLKQHQHYLQQLEPDAFGRASIKTLKIAVEHLHIPKRLTAMMHDIWYLQQRFEQRNGCVKLLEHPKFRAGYDFLLIRAQANPVDEALATWWQSFYDGDAAVRQKLITGLQQTEKPRSKRRRSRRKKPAAQPESTS